MAADKSSPKTERPSFMFRYFLDDESKETDFNRTMHSAGVSNTDGQQFSVKGSPSVQQTHLLSSVFRIP